MGEIASAIDSATSNERIERRRFIDTSSRLLMLGLLSISGHQSSSSARSAVPVSNQVDIEPADGQGDQVVPSEDAIDPPTQEASETIEQKIFHVEDLQGEDNIIPLLGEGAVIVLRNCYMQIRKDGESTLFVVGYVEKVRGFGSPPACVYRCANANAAQRFASLFEGSSDTNRMQSVNDIDFVKSLTSEKDKVNQENSRSLRIFSKDPVMQLLGKGELIMLIAELDRELEPLRFGFKTEQADTVDFPFYTPDKGMYKQSVDFQFVEKDDDISNKVDAFCQKEE